MYLSCTLYFYVCIHLLCTFHDVLYIFHVYLQSHTTVGGILIIVIGTFVLLSRTTARGMSLLIYCTHIYIYISVCSYISHYVSIIYCRQFHHNAIYMLCHISTVCICFLYPVRRAAVLTWPSHILCTCCKATCVGVTSRAAPQRESSFKGGRSASCYSRPRYLLSRQ